MKSANLLKTTIRLRLNSNKICDNLVLKALIELKDMEIMAEMIMIMAHILRIIYKPQTMNINHYAKNKHFKRNK